MIRSLTALAFLAMLPASVSAEETHPRIFLDAQEIASIKAKVQAATRAFGQILRRGAVQAYLHRLRLLLPA
jgi:hypothetical protein